MKVKLLLLALFLLNIYAVFDLCAQELPLVYDVENSGAQYPKPNLPVLGDLPLIPNLPDPFAWADGRGRLTNKSDWEARRNEIGAQIQNYEIGTRQPRPDTISATFANDTLKVKVTVNGKSLTLVSKVILPSGSGPFPLVIGMNSPSGSVPSSIFTSRNIAQMSFNHDQVTVYYGYKNTDPYFRLYPKQNTDNMGQYAAWSWGVSRLIDGLELVQDVLPIDLKHIAVTGCSYAGKMALFAGAFDERIALTISQESGGGGATSWRYSHSEPAGSVEKIDNTDYNWFANGMQQFSSDKVQRLPEDHHELMAMVAPRALLVTGNPDFIWLSNPSNYVCSKGAEPVYDALGISDRFGYSIIGGHGHCAVPDVQIPEISAFVDKFLLGITTANTNVRTKPAGYTMDLNTWIPWSTPALGNGTSYFGQASLVSPANLVTAVDNKSVTFKWNKVQDAAKYIIQLSTNGSFLNNVLSDSTTSDTVKTFTNLLVGKKYFWRVQVRNNSGLSGPWSSVYSFTTYIDLPAAPRPIAATQYGTRNDTYKFQWSKVQNADQYTIQVSRSITFSTVAVPTASTTDTTKSITGFLEGQKLYWRVQAANVAGSGPWGVDSFATKLTAPTNLVVQVNSSSEVELTWDDNTGYNDGYIVERKEEPQTTFAFLDSVKSGNTYVDHKTGSGKSYSYRIKAYNNKTAESDYSNEASIVTDVKDMKGIPTEFALGQNYPNPFNPTTKIKFALPMSVSTKITVFDLLGREVAILINKELKAGYHEVTFDAGNLVNGVFFYRIEAGNFVQTKKLILMK